MHKDLPVNESGLKIHFAKYHGNGNDFIIIPKELDINDDDFFSYLIKEAQRLCTPKTGIGADGIIFANIINNRLKIRILNADGSIALNCGNGLRCIAKWYFDNFNAESIDIEFEGRHYLASTSQKDIKINMGECLVIPYDSSFLGKAFLCDLGNKHLAFCLKDKPEKINDLVDMVFKNVADAHELNIGFNYVDENKNIRSLVYERGVGFSKSCGSGAIAAACSFSYLNEEMIKKSILVHTEGGPLEINLSLVKVENGEKRFMVSQKGAARYVYDGQFLFL